MYGGELVQTLTVVEITLDGDTRLTLYDHGSVVMGNGQTVVPALHREIPGENHNTVTMAITFMF